MRNKRFKTNIFVQIELPRDALTLEYLTGTNSSIHYFCYNQNMIDETKNICPFTCTVGVFY